MGTFLGEDYSHRTILFISTIGLFIHTMNISITHIRQVILLTIVESFRIILKAIHQLHTMYFLLLNQVFMNLINSTRVIRPSGMIPHDESTLLQSIINCYQRIFYIQSICILQKKSIDMSQWLGTGYFSTRYHDQIRALLYCLRPSIRLIMVSRNEFVRTIFNVIRYSNHIQSTDSTLPYPVFRLHISI